MNEEILWEEMEAADRLADYFVGYVKSNYEKFSPLSKLVSEGKWEEWIRNHIEAKIYCNDGTTLRGDKKLF